MKSKKLLIAVLCMILLVSATAVFVSASGEGPKPKLSVKACNLSFEESVHILYAIEYENVEYSDVEMLYWTTPRQNKNDYLKSNAEYTSKDGIRKTVNGVENCVVFENTQLWAQNMTDVLYARAYVVVNGKEYYSEVKSYSILEYVYNKLGYTGTPTQNKKLQELVSELLEYGAKTQHYFEHNTGKLPTDPHGKVEVNGGHLPDGMEHGFYKTETKVTLSAVTTPDKPYVKWTDKDGKVIGYGETIEVTVKDTSASFTAECYNLYSVSFVDSDGTVLKTVNDLLLGDTFTPPVLEEREGFTFLGWAVEEGADAVYGADAEIVMGDDATDTYYAVWLPDNVEGTPGLIYMEYGNGEYCVSGYEGTATEIVIGNTHNGRDVVGIWGGAFMDNTSITKVRISEGVRFINGIAFAGCTSLTSVTLPESLTSIDSGAFMGSGLTSILIPDSVTEMNINVFNSCTALETVVIGDGLTSIPENSFANCTSLKSITIGKNVTEIGNGAFDASDEYIIPLESITLPVGLKSIGQYAFRGCKNLTEINIPNGVETIGSGAFEGLEKLSKVTLSSSLTVIPERAFARCKALDEITIPDSVALVDVSAFSDCEALATVNIGTDSAVSSIGNYAFSGCKALTSVYIPAGVETIGDYAFGDCTALETVTFVKEGDLTSIGWGAFRFAPVKELILPDKLETIGYQCFVGCSSLSSISIGANLKSVGDDAFASCDLINTVSITDLEAWCTVEFADYDSNPLWYSHDLKVNGEPLTELVVPESVTRLGSYTFAGLTTLTKATLHGGITEIGDGAFMGCTSLASVNIPDGITKIGDETFRECPIPSVIIPDTVITIGSSAFYYNTAVTAITIPASVTELGGYAFGDCSKLGEVTFAEGSKLTLIGGSAFSYCPIVEIEIPDGVTEIGASAFNSCRSLTKVEIPSSVTTIQHSAFSNCSSLVTVVIPSGVTTMGYDVFYGCTGLTVYAEIASAPEGWNTNWNSSDCTVIWNACGKNDEYEWLVGADGLVITGYVGSDTEISIPASINGASVVEIGEAAFEGSNITSVTIQNGITKIGVSAFSGCSSLKTVNLPDSVTTIGMCAFMGCSSLETIFISENVTYIGQVAFFGCNRLTICCEAAQKAAGWDPAWNASSCIVLWNSTKD